MQNPWLTWWHDTAETIGIALAFSFGGSGFVLWSGKDYSVQRGLVVILAGLVVTAVATALVHGYFGGSAYLAPLVGLVCGIVAMPVLNAVAQISRERALEAVGALVNKALGKKDPP